MADPPLGKLLKPCGPVLDAAAAQRAREALRQAAGPDGWRRPLDHAWPALAPVFGASPYLAGRSRALRSRSGSRTARPAR